MKRPLTQIYFSNRDYSTLQEVEIVTDENGERRFNIFQSVCAYFFIVGIATLSIIDFFFN